MTDILDPLPASDLKINSHAPHPPFPWTAAIPSDWVLLDTNPESWQRNAERIVDDRFHGRRLRAAERRAVLDFLEQLVADCQRAGAALSMVQLGRMSTGAVGSAGLHLGWFDSTPQPAGLALVRQSLSRTGTVEEVETPRGPGLLHRDVAFTVPPGALTRVRSTVLQLYLPLPGTTWTAVLSAATPHPELERMLADAIVAVAHAISPADPTNAAEPTDATDPTDAVEPRAGADGTGDPGDAEGG
ncbi:hypothetical protein GA0070618_5827 [Micromonospora echinospora]|uniref:Uncharacterized protein n=1 Tax=Micromonospora echinospora TaxID=1877 RepID=A0A1C4ZV50_MICEC|nr:hypothetical protein [Micromonospora echinospora]SCF36820.1 hypothetical protein GA0070618_5827 [Micromonospora echinospora]